jgi:hypothetical protein
MLNPDYWIDFAEAVSQIDGIRGSLEGKKYCIDRLSKGLITADAYRAKITTDYATLNQLMNPLDFGKNTEILNWEQVDFHNIMVFAETRLEQNWDIPEYFWNPQLLESDRTWIRVNSQSWIGLMVWADWESFEFEIIRVIADGYFDDGDARYLITKIYVLGISLERPALSSVLASKSKSNDEKAVQISVQEAGQNWQYDWLGAFAHVAARCRFDAVLEDINARGTNREIVNMMKDWFGTSQPKMPGETILKEKAEIVLKELRKQFSQSPTN